jgi:hypothetical protein
LINLLSQRKSIGLTQDRAEDRLLHQTSQDQAPILQIYNNLALCYESQEFYLPAIKTYKESYATAEKMQDKYGILHATRGLGNVYAIQDEEEKPILLLK